MPNRQPITWDGRRSNRNYEKQMKRVKEDEHGHGVAPDIQKGHRVQDGEIVEYSQRCDGRYGMISKVKSGAGAFLVCKVGTGSTRGECSGRKKKRGPKPGKHTVAVAHTVDGHEAQRAEKNRLAGNAAIDQPKLKKFHKLHTLILWGKANNRMKDEFDQLEMWFRRRFSKARFRQLLQKLEQRRKCVEGQQKSKKKPLTGNKMFESC